MERLKGKLILGQKTYRWYDSGWQDDSPVPEGLFSAEETARVRAMTRAERTRIMNATLGHCDHAIQFPGCRYEVGVRANADGTFTLLYDFWSAGGLPQYLGGPKLPKLAQMYATELLKAESRRIGGAVETEEVLEDGSVRLVLLAAAR